MSRQFNETVCMHHLFLDGERIFDAMDVSSCYSAELVCDTTTIEWSICAFGTVWLSPFWFTSNIEGDQAFKHPTFRAFYASIGASFLPVPPRPHSKMNWSPSTVFYSPSSFVFVHKFRRQLPLLLNNKLLEYDTTPMAHRPCQATNWHMDTVVTYPTFHRSSRLSSPKLSSL